MEARKIGASNAARRDRRALARNLPCDARGERGAHATRPLVSRGGEDLRPRTALERPARTLVQGPGWLAGGPAPSRAGAIFHSRTSSTLWPSSTRRTERV